MEVYFFVPLTFVVIVLFSLFFLGYAAVAFIFEHIVIFSIIIWVIAAFVACSIAKTENWSRIFGISALAVSALPAYVMAVRVIKEMMEDMGVFQFLSGLFVLFMGGCVLMLAGFAVLTQSEKLANKGKEVAGIGLNTVVAIVLTVAMLSFKNMI